MSDRELAARSALMSLVSATTLSWPSAEIHLAATDEHARYRLYSEALRDASPAVEREIVLAVLSDPDVAMRESALGTYVDHRAGRSQSPAEFDEWARSIGELLTAPYLARRLAEWRLLKLLEAGESADPRELIESSDWLQRRITETAGVREDILRVLAQSGRSRRIRAAAQRRIS